MGQRNPVFFHIIYLNRLTAAGRRSDRAEIKTDEGILAAAEIFQGKSQSMGYLVHICRFTADEKKHTQEAEQQPAAVGILKKKKKCRKVIATENDSESRRHQQEKYQNITAIGYFFFAAGCHGRLLLLYIDPMLKIHSPGISARG